jgi:hypothetical protein
VDGGVKIHHPGSLVYQGRKKGVERGFFPEVQKFPHGNGTAFRVPGGAGDIQGKKQLVKPPVRGEDITPQIHDDHGKTGFGKKPVKGA